MLVDKDSRFAFFALILIAACTGDPATTSKQSTDGTQVPPKFTTPIVMLTPADGETQHYGIKDCHVYRAYSENENWEILFEPATYPLPQQCVRERLEFDGEYIQIEIGTQALGAGGCCTNYAAYRSKDGEIGRYARPHLFPNGRHWLSSHNV